MQELAARRLFAKKQTLWERFVRVARGTLSVLALMAASFLGGMVTGLYLPNYVLTKKIEALSSEKEKLCKELYGPEASVVHGMCATKNGRVARK